jgi:uncharacterized protein
MKSITSRSIVSSSFRYVLPLAVGLLSLGLFSSVTATSAQAQQSPEPVLRTLTVSGQGMESIPTTLTQVRLGVEVQGRTAEDVQKQAASRSSAVVNLLRSRNVQKLQTTGINLNPIYNYENNTQRITGYSATNIVSFEIPTDQAGTLLDDAVSAGATRIEGVSFIATDEAIATARQQALREATQEAQTQADTVLSALGLTRREVIGIQINGASAPPPRPIPMAAMARSEADAPTPVVGGEQEVDATVTLQIRY